MSLSAFVTGRGILVHLRVVGQVLDRIRSSRMLHMLRFCGMGNVSSVEEPKVSVTNDEHACTVYVSGIQHDLTGIEARLYLLVMLGLIRWYP